MLGLLKNIQVKRRMGSDPVGYARSIGVRVGERCRLLGIDGWTFGSEPWLVAIGDHVTVTGGVRFLTHDGGLWVFREEHPDADYLAPITVGNNVFIGLNVLLLPGVTVGDNCIVGAGAVVTKDIPANSIAVGVPARVVRTLGEYWTNIQPRLQNTGRLTTDEKRVLKSGLK